MRAFIRSPLFAIFLIVFVDVLGIGITVPVLPLFAKDELGASAFQIGLLPTVYFIVQTVAAPWLGRLSDRIGRRPVLIVSQLGTLMALLMSAWAPTLVWLLAARALDGLTGGNVSVAFAYVGDVSKPEERARSIGVIHAGFGAGFMFGPAIGGYLGGLYGPRVPFLAAAAVSLVSIMLSLFRLKESRRPQSLPPVSAPSAVSNENPSPSAPRRLSFGEIASLPGVPRILVIAFFTQLALLCFTSMWVLWADATVLSSFEKSAQQKLVGQVFTVLGVFQLITQALLVGRLVNSIGEKKMITLGLVTRGAAWAVMALVPSLGVMFLCLPFASFGSGIAQPALMALLTFAIPPHMRGQAIGVLAAAESTGRMLGPLVAGLLFEAVAPGAPIIVAGGISVFAALIALTLRIKNPDNPFPVASHGAKPP